MGWTSFYIGDAEKTGEILTREFTSTTTGENGRVSWRVVDQSTHGATWYAILEKTTHNIVTGEPVGAPLYCGVVCLTGRENRRGRDSTFYYKDMGEETGPYKYDAPLRIINALDRLAPNPGGYAKEWRQKCRDNAAAKLQRAKRKLLPGQTIKTKTGNLYKLVYTAGPRRGWYITDAGKPGTIYRMSAAGLNKCDVVASS